MKKFLKNCTITAVVFIIIGFVITLVGGSYIGAKAVNRVVEDVTNGKVNVNLESLKDFGITIGEGFGQDFYEIDGDSIKIDFKDGVTIYEGHMDKTGMGKEIAGLNIKVGGCELKVVESDDDNFYVEANGVGKIQGYVEDGVLNIISRSKQPEKINLNRLGEYSITLYVPEGCCFEKANIELGAGELLFDGLHAKKADISLGAGKMLMQSLVSDELKMEVGAGEIDTNKMVVGSLIANVGMGNLEINGEVTKSMKLSCAMGNITANLLGNEEDFNYEIECSMGNIELNDTEYAGLAQSKKIDNDADKDMKLECAMGNIEVNF